MTIRREEKTRKLKVKRTDLETFFIKKYCWKVFVALLLDGVEEIDCVGYFMKVHMK